MKNTFLLVHGAWLGGWCWDKLCPLLEAEGHTVIAPDMPGHGADDILISEQNLEKYARAVEALITPLEEPVILVGHSFGGMIISQAACYVPNKIKKLVYISAFLPQNGQSCVGITKEIHPTFHEKIIASGHDFIISADGKTSRVEPTLCAEFVYNDIPKVYVRCTMDKVVEQRLQDKMISETYCGEVYTLETGHCPFESAPNSLADILLRL